MEVKLYDKDGKEFIVQEFDKLINGGFITEGELTEKKTSPPDNVEDSNLVFEGMFKEDDSYYFIDSCGNIDHSFIIYGGGEPFRKRLEIGNAFPTISIAEKAKELRFGLNGQIMTRILWENEKEGFETKDGEESFVIWRGFPDGKVFSTHTCYSQIGTAGQGSEKSTDRVMDILKKYYSME